MVYKSFFRKKTTHIYLFIIFLISFIFFLLLLGKNYYINIANKDYEGSYISIIDSKDLDDVLSRISGIKSIDKGITYEDITFISDNTLKENEIIIAELNKEEYPKNSYLTLNNYNLIVVGHQKKSNIFYLNSNTLNNIISNTKKTTYIIDLTNWADYNRISDKIIEKTEGFVGIHLNKESKVNYELVMLIFNIFIILNIILFIIILVVTIFNILEDEKKSSLMYRALGFTKLKIIKTNILKLIYLFILAIIPSIMLTSILYFLIN